IKTISAFKPAGGYFALYSFFLMKSLL
ncbi:pantothenic acid transporter pant, partial [Streptococcus pneumoniae]